MRFDIVLYHGNCLDGFAAATIAWQKLGDAAHYIPLYYKNGLPWPRDRQTIDCTGKKVLIVDVSSSSISHIHMLTKGASHVTWLDHHETTFRAFGLDPAVKPIEAQEDGGFRVILNHGECGAMMAHTHLFGSKPPEVLKFIDAYDRGGTFHKWAPEGTDEVVKALWSHTPWTFPAFAEMLKRPVIEYLRDGAAISRYHEGLVLKAIDRSVGMMLLGLVIPSVNCEPALHSAVGHALAKSPNNPTGVAICWYIAETGKVYCGVRSCDGRSALLLATEMGGGGHGDAAGFEISLPELVRVLAV